MDKSLFSIAKAVNICSLPQEDQHNYLGQLLLQKPIVNDVGAKKSLKILLSMFEKN